MKVAILDDYQNVALQLADWSAVRQHAEITVFNDHLADPAGRSPRTFHQLACWPGFWRHDPLAFWVAGFASPARNAGACYWGADHDGGCGFGYLYSLKDSGCSPRCRYRSWVHGEIETRQIQS